MPGQTDFKFVVVERREAEQIGDVLYVFPESAQHQSAYLRFAQTGLGTSLKAAGFLSRDRRGEASNRYRDTVLAEQLGQKGFKVVK